MKLFSNIPLVVRCFFVADLAVCALFLGNHAIGRPWSKINLFLDLDHEGNFPAWYSSMQWATVSALMFFSGTQKRRWKKVAGLPLLFLGALFLFFSMDEVAQVHENLTEGIKWQTPQGERDQDVLLAHRSRVAAIRLLVAVRTEHQIGL